MIFNLETAIYSAILLIYECEKNCNRFSTKDC